MSRFSISPATWRDVKELHRLEEVCFEKDAWPMLDLIAVLTLPASVRYKATVDEKMVGFIAGDQHHREKVGWVTTVGVLPEYRNQGIATALMLVAETSLGMPRVRLCVRRTNLSAQRLYTRLGYRQIDTWRHYYSGREDALVFEKEIDAGEPPDGLPA